MNDFINLLSERIQNKSANELIMLIEMLAQYVPEQKQKYILEHIDGTYAVITNRHADLDVQGIFRKIEELRENIDNYNIQAYYVECYERECYNDYNEEDGYHIEDDGGFTDAFLNCYNGVKKILENGIFKDAYYGFSLLFEVIQDFDNFHMYDDTGEFPFEAFIDEGFLNIDLRHMKILWGYCRLQTPWEDDDKALSEIYLMLSEEKGRVMIKDLLSACNQPISDLNVFLEKWIQFLYNCPPQKASMFVKEAAILIGKLAVMEDFVETTAKSEPAAYIDLLNLYMEHSMFQEAVSIGCKGLGMLDKNLLGRSKLAESLIAVAKTAQNEQAYRFGVVERYHSNPCVSNFLPLFGMNQIEIDRAIARLEEVRINKIDRMYSEYDYYFIRFLNGDFELVFEAIRNDKKPLGWSGSLKGRMIPLFIGLLAGFDKRCTNIFNAIEHILPYGTDFSAFKSVLCNQHKNISLLQEETYLQRCVEEVSKRTDAIVSNQYRGSYYKAATLLYTVGEMMACREEAAPFQMAESFKVKYPRHSAFKSELNYAMKNVDKAFK